MDKNSEQKKILNSSEDAIKKLKEIGFKEISNRTFINKENLEHLLNREFEKLHKTKALGFIQILEREFGVDLGGLKNEYNFYKKHGRLKAKTETKTAPKIKKDHSQRVRTKQKNRVKSKNIKKRNTNSLLKAIAWLSLFLVGIVGYTLIKNGSGTKDIEIKEINNTSTKNIDSKNNSLIDDTINSNDKTKSSDNKDDMDLNEMVNKMLKDINETSLKDNNKDELIDSNIISKDLSKSEQKNTNLSKENNNKDNMSKLSSTLQEIEGLDKVDKINADRTNKDKQEQITQKISSLNTHAKTKKESPKKIATKSLYIIPIQKAWVGVIYIDDLSKKDYLIRANKKLRLDPSRDQIILVGHNKFKIYNKNREKMFSSKKMVRFLYQNGDLREIGKEEYLDLSAGVHW